jgi:hypothetical protein
MATARYLIAAGLILFVAFGAMHLGMRHQQKVRLLADRVSDCEQAARQYHRSRRACTWIRDQYEQADKAWF